MSASDLLHSLLSDELFAVLVAIIETVSAHVSAGIDSAAQYVRHGAQVAYAAYNNCSSPVQLEFSELQTSLLSVFLVIISVNVLLITYYWSKYGGVITDRFIRPSMCCCSRFYRFVRVVSCSDAIPNSLCMCCVHTFTC